MERILWQNIDLNIEDWDDGEIFEGIEDEGEKMELIESINNDDFNILIEENCIRTGEIIAIGNLGIWKGRIQGYKDVGNYLSDCFDTDCPYVKWYVDGRKNLRATMRHHDGTNYVLYREFKENLSEEQKENFRDKVWSGKATSRDISRYTRRLGDYFTEFYGF